MKRIWMLLVLSCALTLSNGQSEKTSKNNFGFSFGANYSSIKPGSSLQDMEINNGLGFRLGMMYERSISSLFSLAPKAELSFNRGDVALKGVDQLEYRRYVMPVTLEFMLHGKFSIGDDKTRPYFLIGPNLKLPLSFEEKSTSEFGDAPDLAIDFGFGILSHRKHFSIAPELRYSYGLMNVNVDPQFQTIYYHNLALVIAFS